MIDIFVIGTKTLLILTSFCFLLLFFLYSAWSQPKHPERHYIIGFLLSTLFTFLFFLGGFLLLVLINTFYKYIFPFFQSWKFLF